jgi:REP element-mobilizing transposase RayT
MIKIPKIHIPGALYYVTTCGDHNEEVFEEEQDYKTYLGLLKKYKEQYGFKLFSFVLLPNHFHLLFELKEGITISDIMHDLNANYTKYFNARYGRKGHLFQERSKMVLAEKDTYLLPIIAHMHLDPSFSVIERGQNYPYSSHFLYASFLAPAGGEDKGEGLGLTEEINEVLEKLSAANYIDFMKNISSEEMQILGNDLKKKSILGSEEFIKKVEAIAQNLQLSDSREPKTENREPNPQYIRIGSAIVVILGIFTCFLYARSMALKQNLNKEMAKKEAEINTKLVIERKKIVQDLEEKHQADMVSYEAMAKRLEFEKKRALELEQKITN